MAKENVDKVIIRKGENIIREGEVITGDRLELLRELGILTEESRFDFVLYTGVAAVVLVIELLIIAYILAFNRKLLAQPKRLLMVYIIFIFTLIISRAVQGISIYLIPIAASSMLLSILLESDWLCLLTYV